MKKLIIGVFVIVNFSSQASFFKEFKASDFVVVNKMFEICPTEAARLMTAGYTSVIAGEYINGMTRNGIVNVYSFKIVQNLPAPVFEMTEWKLEAIEYYKEWPGGIVPEDASNYMIERKCNVDLIK